MQHRRLSEWADATIGNEPIWKPARRLARLACILAAGCALLQHTRQRRLRKVGNWFGRYQFADRTGQGITGQARARGSVRTWEHGREQSRCRGAPTRRSEALPAGALVPEHERAGMQD